MSQEVYKTILNERVVAIVRGLPPETVVDLAKAYVQGGIHCIEVTFDQSSQTAFVDVLAEGEVAFGSTEFIVMRARPGVSDPQFVYYLATSPAFRNVAIKSMVGSSGRQRVQQGVLEKLELTVPPLDEQKKIGAFLAALDKKIALNSKINDNLAA